MVEWLGKEGIHMANEIIRQLGIQRYKRILGRAMHSRKLLNQIQEAMIGCGVLNKMTSLGMPDSSKIC